MCLALSEIGGSWGKTTGLSTILGLISLLSFDVGGGGLKR